MKSVDRPIQKRAIGLWQVDANLGARIALALGIAIEPGAPVSQVAR